MFKIKNHRLFLESTGISNGTATVASAAFTAKCMVKCYL